MNIIIDTLNKRLQIDHIDANKQNKKPLKYLFVFL